MESGGHQSLPPIEQIISAYEASSSGESRQVLSCTLLSSTVKIRKSFLEYDVSFLNQHGVQGREVVIGKVYSDEEKGIAAYRLMQYVWNQGMNTDPYNRIVRPIAFLKEWRLLLMSKAPGRSLDSYIHEGNNGRQAGRLVANWLTKLHSIPPVEVQPIRRTRATADIGRFVRELEAAWPNKASEVRAIYDQLLENFKEPWRGEPVLLHGDFHPNNVFVDGLQVYGIDFDHYFAGDPAWDVTYLTCQMQISAYVKRGNFHDSDEIVMHTLSYYLNAHPAMDRKAFLERLHYYRARSLFESSHYELCVMKNSNLDTINVFLHECKQSLQGKGFR
jgi:aminoglycoside phosphotransferase (APT) family kinase protein